MIICAMDKKGNAMYIRLPISLKATVEKMAEEDGRTYTEEAVYLMWIGSQLKNLIDSKFHVRDCRIEPDEGQEKTCLEITTILNKKNMDKKIR